MEEPNTSTDQSGSRDYAHDKQSDLLDLNGNPNHKHETPVPKSDQRYSDDKVDELIEAIGSLLIRKLRSAKIGEIVLATTSVALVIVGIGQVLVAWENYQDTSPLVGYAKASSKAAQDAANAAQDSADAAQQFADSAQEINTGMGNAVDRLSAQATATQSASETAKQALLSERGFVVVSNATIDTGRNFWIRIANSGRLPTGKVHSLFYGEVRSDNPNDRSGNTPQLVERKFWFSDDYDSIPVGVAPFEHVPIPAADFDRLTSGTQMIVIVGIITYNDGFPDTPQRVIHVCNHTRRMPSLNKFEVDVCNFDYYNRQLVETGYLNPELEIH